MLVEGSSRVFAVATGPVQCSVGVVIAAGADAAEVRLRLTGSSLLLVLQWTGAGH